MVITDQFIIQVIERDGDIKLPTTIRTYRRTQIKPTPQLANCNLWIN